VPFQNKTDSDSFQQVVKACSTLAYTAAVKLLSPTEARRRSESLDTGKNRGERLSSEVSHNGRDEHPKEQNKVRSATGQYPTKNTGRVDFATRHPSFK
jgi:hypothetical protein